MTDFFVGGGGGSRNCFKCNESGHMARECPNAEQGMYFISLNTVNVNKKMLVCQVDSSPMKKLKKKELPRFKSLKVLFQQIVYKLEKMVVFCKVKLTKALVFMPHLWALCFLVCVSVRPSSG